jgi:Clp protease
MAASMGAFLLGAGAPGKRRALPNSRIMIHQPLGGAQGQAADIEIQAKEILFIREVLNTYIADYTGQTKDKVEADCDRDFFMTPEEAVEYGIIDEGTKQQQLGWMIHPWIVSTLRTHTIKMSLFGCSDQNQNEPYYKALNADTISVTASHT